MNMHFSELYKIDFEIHDIFAIRQNFWYHDREFAMKVPRPSDAILYFQNCDGFCTLSDGERKYVPNGSFMHIARGAKYTWYIGKDCREEPITWLFEFNLKDENGNLISTGDGVNAMDVGDAKICKMLFNKLLHEFSRPSQFPAAIKLCAYSFLNEIIQRHRTLDVQTGIISEEIYEGIRYLEDDTNQSKSIAEVASMCKMSLGSFEKQFKRYSGVTPMEYRTNRKLDRAEKMLRTSSMTIEQIAEGVGLYDGAYLCRLFKKKRGISPRAYRNIK